MFPAATPRADRPPDSGEGPDVRVCLAAGGTGGHLLPGLALGKALRQRGHLVHFVVKKDEASQARLAAEGFPSSALFFEGFPRALSFGALAYPWVAWAAYRSAARIGRRESPGVVVGMGGYVSVPLGLWAGLHRIPLVLHEQNVRAGLANRFLSRWAAAIGVTFDGAMGLPVERCVKTGLPLRPDLAPGDPGAARRALGLNENDGTILVFGGSQGARALNARWIEALPRLRRPGETWQFIHLTGPADEAAVRAAYERDGRRAFVRAYYSDMAAVYSAADAAVGRAGANTVMEIYRMGKTALLVPFPHATNDHQAANARALARDGGATVVPEKELTVDRIAEVVVGWPSVTDLRRENERRLASVPADFLRAADRLADAVEAAGKEGLS